MNTRHAASSLFPFLAMTTLAMSACSRQESVREIDWAKAALARNPAFEIVATDETSGVFTVRDTRTGAMRTLELGELIAAPLPPREAAPRPEAPPMPAETPDVEAEEPALAANQTTEPPPAPAPAPPAAELPAATDAGVEPGQGAALATGPGYSITKGAPEKPAVADAAMEGPGYRIEAGAAPATADDSTRRVNVERRSDPIICQGNRLMRIDGETIEFTGDAIVAERGCDLYISNARIRAGGVGIIARQQARVHIVNSTIGGTRGSYEASDGAEIYVARSTFTGVGRRFGGGTMTDLGGNSYQAH